MTLGERYCAAMLVRVVGPNFVAGLLIEDDRVIFAAPILRHYMGQHADKLRQGFKRMGWKATIVRPKI